MANRRMFSQRVVGDESFLEMPPSTQNLYFHLGIYADDDGFVNPQKVIRMIGANPDDLKVLKTKKFVIPFESGVIVITHWKENNYIQNDRKTPTIYQKELKTLDCIQNVYKLDTQVRLGKVRLGKDKLGNIQQSDALQEETQQTPLKEKDPINELFDVFHLKGILQNYGNKTHRQSAKDLIAKFGLEESKNLAEFAISLLGKEYAPRINNPYELKSKLGSLMAEYKKQNNKINYIKL